MFAAISMQLSAQATHEFSAHAGVGLSSLSYQLSQGKRSGGFGGDFGFGYTYFINREQAVETGTVSYMNWGIHSGIGLGFYNAKAKLNNVKTLAKGLDDGEPTFSKFDLETTLSGYNETQKTMFLNIPVMGLLQMDQFYAMGGFKFGIPVSDKFKSKDATLKNRANYPDLGKDVWIETQTFRGLGEFNGKNYDGKLDLGVAVMFSLEAGYKWSIDDNLSLYTGVFFDYGLNNVYKEANPKLSFVEYNTANPSDFTMSSRPFTDKITPIAAGVKLRLSFGMGSTVKEINYDDDAEDARLAEQEAARKAAEEAFLAEQEAARKAFEARLAEEAARKATEEAARKVTEETARKATQKAETNNQNIIDKIQEPVQGYELMASNLTASQKKKMDEKVALLKQYPDWNIFIYGHTCEIGDDAINEKIGLQRAEKAKAYLISKGINAKRILGTAIKRDTEPLVSNTSEENRKVNRRVVIVVQ